MLESVHLANPDCNWWLKGDRCDVVGGLGESTRFVWSGDVDHNDGEVQKMYQTYRNLLDFIASMRTITCDTVANLKKCSALLLQEKEFLVKGNYDYRDEIIILLLLHSYQECSENLCTRKSSAIKLVGPMCCSLQDGQLKSYRKCHCQYQCLSRFP